MVHPYSALILLFLSAAALPAGAQRGTSAAPQDPPSFKWWQSERFRTELALTPQQSAQLEEVFQGALPQMRTLKQDLDRHEALLDVLIKESSAPETQVAQQIDRLEATRSEMSKVRTLMLFRMRRLLSSDQRAKMDDMHRRWEQDRRKAARPPR